MNLGYFLGERGGRSPSLSHSSITRPTFSTCSSIYGSERPKGVILMFGTNWLISNL